MARKFLLLSLVVILSALALISYWYMNSSARSGADILLSPTTNIYKKRPAERGGKVIANSDNLIYENLKFRKKAKTNIEVLPEPELPVKLEYQQLGTDADAIDAILSGAGVEESSTTNAVSNPDMSDILDTVVVNELNETTAANDPTTTTTTSQTKEQEEEHDVVKDSGLNITIVPSRLYKLARPNGKIEDLGSGYKLQLSVVSSEAEVESEWQRIKQQHTEILKDSNLMVRKISGKNDRIFFQIMSGSYKSLSKAKAVCKKLLEHKQSCIVTK